ncbi:hypothetical protein J5N97_028551 [Dioscorea zingiberensis]|uniref:Uncharacterized protein n=1 Tax=Dioscorea zingiberensis TaxID=325984 RepID=A0A9D5BZP0_9LILI|nr:hypothetical protein J5N97_028551 [Dioscorea zingiberensis]
MDGVELDSKWKILSLEDDTDFLVKQHWNLVDYKPEFVYNAIRSILDSSFNKAGMVRAIYVKINNGVLFEVKPYARLPRTCKRFCGIMVDFLQKPRICSGDGNEALLRVIEEPFASDLCDSTRERETFTIRTKMRKPTSSLKKPKRKLRDEENTREGESNKIELLGKRKIKMKDEDRIFELPGFPSVSSLQKKKPGVIFILEKASLTLAYVGKKFQVLHPDEHADFMRKKNMDPYRYRSDILYEALSIILGSRLNSVGCIDAIYVKTDDGVLIKVDPRASLPKSLTKFRAMTSKLLQKFNVKAKGTSSKLFHLIKNPVTQYLPVNSRKIGLSFSSQEVVDIDDYVSSASDDTTLVFVVGAMAHGKIDQDYTDEFISICKAPLSANACLMKICVALEESRDIFCFN